MFVFARSASDFATYTTQDTAETFEKVRPTSSVLHSTELQTVCSKDPVTCADGAINILVGDTSNTSV